MNKYKVFSVIALLLLITNIVLVLAIFFDIPLRPNPKKGPREIIIHKLDFNDEQIKKYDALIELHRSAIRQKNNMILELKNQLYCTLNSDSLTTANKLIMQIGKEEIALEEINFEHFKQIKTLCRTDQMSRFNELTKELSQLFVSRNKRR